MAEYRVPNINNVHITGNLTGDPDLRYTPDGQPVCNFQIASNRRYMDKKTNEWKDITTFVRVTCWRQLAERMGEVLRKGSAVYVEGMLQSRSWETPEGQKRTAIDISALRIQNLTKSSGIIKKEEEKSEEKLPEKKNEEEQEEGKELPF
ncbi:single-stranded DNA-binding protein [candidate division WOR-3 bacterium]|nr:single-stranded DNA-binding protein [candidate division WOR-3 bacterium]